MTKLAGLEMTVDALSEKEYSKFRQWVFEHDWEKWDRKIEGDSRPSKLDFQIREAFDAKKRGDLENL